MIQHQSADEVLKTNQQSQIPTSETAHKAEPLPKLVEEPATEVVASPAPPENVWQRMRNGFQLSHEVNRNRVLTELKWYVNHPEYVDRVAKRAAPHLPYIVEEISKRGLPMEFALLPIVESAYDPFAYSHGRAAGLWQFIPSTGRLYGLRIDWWDDGRRDVRTSTKAAIDYLEYLHGLFNGDWLLALAAYNAGQGNVMSSIRKSGLNPDDAEFWNLDILKETYTYVPRLLAISELINNPARYHIELPDVANEPFWEVVTIGSQIDLNVAADVAEVSAQEMYKLNPGFNQWATHPEGPHELVVPVTQADIFRKNLVELPHKERVAWHRHKIRYGESLGSIATKYRTTVSAIKSTNKIKGNLIKTGDSLLIPSASDDKTYAMSAAGRLASKQDYLQKSIGSTPIIYTVQQGDSFWEVSRRFDVGMRELAKWNGMGTTATLFPGTKLKIFKESPLLKTTYINEQVRKLNYRIRKGESLSHIAVKFNISVQDIRTWNQRLINEKYIHPGDQLTLFIDVTALIN